MRGDWLTLAAVGSLAIAGAVRRRGSANEDCEGPFFHTTTWDRLASIAQDGLRTDYRSRFGGWYQGHSQGRTFVAQGAYEGSAWWHRVSSAVEQGAEIREQDELVTIVPVMLRIDLRGIALAQDQAATMDGRDCGFYVTETIEPDRIWFYDGSSKTWRPIDEWEESDPWVSISSWSEEWEPDDPDMMPWIEFQLDGAPFAPPDYDDEAAAQGWEVQRQGSSNDDQDAARETRRRNVHVAFDVAQQLFPVGFPLTDGRVVEEITALPIVNKVVIFARKPGDEFSDMIHLTPDQVFALSKKKGSAVHWDSPWWKSASKPVRVDGEAGQIFKVGHRLVLAFDIDLNAYGGFDPAWRWSFQVRAHRIVELRPTKRMEARYRRSFGNPSTHRHLPPNQRPWEKLKRRIQSDLQYALDAKRRR